jgi:hypothetical protein
MVRNGTLRHGEVKLRHETPPQFRKEEKMRKTKKDLYIFHFRADDFGVVVWLNDKEWALMSDRLKKQSDEVESWMVPACPVNYRELARAWDIDAENRSGKAEVPVSRMPLAGERI